MPDVRQVGGEAGGGGKAVASEPGGRRSGRIGMRVSLCCTKLGSHLALWTLSQASAALARKKGKGLHEDVAIFWHKKKISEFSVMLCRVSSAL